MADLSWDKTEGLMFNWLHSMLYQNLRLLSSSNNSIYWGNTTMMEEYITNMVS